MPAAAARRARAPQPPARGKGARRRGRASRAQPLEQRVLLTATLCLLAFGAVMVYSASSATSLLQGRGTGSAYLIKFLVYGAIGLVLMRVLARDGLARVQGVIGPLLAVSFVLVLAVHVPHLGVSVNGARRWLGTGPLQFQPSELLKLALLLYAATLLARRPERVHDLRELLNPLLVVVGGACLLIATQPDLGTTMVIICTTVALLVTAGIPMRKLVLLAGALVALVLLYAIVRPYARARLTSFMNPWAHAAGSGFQAVQGQIAIGSGGVLRAGPGEPAAPAHTCASCPRRGGAVSTPAGAKRHDGAVSSAPRRIVIAAGGTAGHVVPALAVAEALRAEGAEVAFIGGARAEARLVPAAGFQLHTIAVEALSRTNPLRAVRALARAAAALPRARRILAALAPDAVMGGGGYVAGPVALAALTLRLPVVLTEADSRMGLSNRILAPFARRVCLAFPPSSRRSRLAARASRRYRVTGRPMYPRRH